MNHAVHLVRRFLGSLRPGGPSADDEAWARAHLVPGEVALWTRMSNPDRRHAVGVARRAVEALGSAATRPVIAAALLHDVGKIEAGLGTFGRVAVTLRAGRSARQRLAVRESRAARYLRHDEIGAALLRDAGADPLTVAWARQHHQPEAAWTLPHQLAAALKAADDD